MNKSIPVRHLIGFVKEKALFAFAKIGFFTSNTLQDLANHFSERFTYQIEFFLNNFGSSGQTSLSGREESQYSNQI